MRDGGAGFQKRMGTRDVICRTSALLQRGFCELELEKKELRMSLTPTISS